MRKLGLLCSAALLSIVAMSSSKAAIISYTLTGSTHPDTPNLPFSGGGASLLLSIDDGVFYGPGYNINRNTLADSGPYNPPGLLNDLVGTGINAIYLSVFYQRPDFFVTLKNFNEFAFSSIVPYLQWHVNLGGGNGAIPTGRISYNDGVSDVNIFLPTGDGNHNSDFDICGYGFRCTFTGTFSVPEPASVVLLGSSIIGLAAFVRRRKTRTINAYKIKETRIRR